LIALCSLPDLHFSLQKFPRTCNNDSGITMADPQLPFNTNRFWNRMGFL
jgi:hypothetical protein